MKPRLTLSTETLRTLTGDALDDVHGGADRADNAPRPAAGDGRPKIEGSRINTLPLSIFL